VTETPASETQQETGGTIDLKADQPDGQSANPSSQPPTAAAPAENLPAGKQKATPSHGGAG
jgi:hypothetical protein